MNSKSNPSLQCSVCGKWMRLHGKDEDGIAFQRFYPCCGDHGEHEHVKDVCNDCCKDKCPYRAATLPAPPAPAGMDERAGMRWIKAGVRLPRHLSIKHCRVVGNEVELAKFTGWYDENDKMFYRLIGEPGWQVDQIEWLDESVCLPSQPVGELPSEVTRLREENERMDKNLDRITGNIEIMRENKVADEMTIGQQGDEIKKLRAAIDEVINGSRPANEEEAFSWMYTAVGILEQALNK